MLFRDRRDAGRRLAGRLEGYAAEDVTVLALPRGGVPVAYEIARALRAPLDVIGVRKLGAPAQPEFGIGAIAEGDVRIVDERSAAIFGLDRDDLERIVGRERQEMRRRIECFRGDRGLPDLAGRTAIVVDDGLATGVTAQAALRAIDRLGAGRRVLAVPVCARDTVERLRPEADDIVCLSAPADFMAVGAWYEEFEQTNDAEVLELLAEAGARSGGGGPR